MIERYSTDVSVVHCVIDEILAAWRAGDGARYGHQFSTTCRYVAFDGTVLSGGPAIGHYHQAAFDRHLRHTALELSLDEVKPIGIDAWLAYATSDVRRLDGSNAERTGRSAQTFVFLRHDGVMLVEAFQNTRIHRIVDPTTAEAWRTFDAAWRAHVS